MGVMTCRHYRFQIPREDADELRAADPEPCLVCDSLPRRNFQTIVWSPRTTAKASRPNHRKLPYWLLNLFHHSRPEPKVATSSC